MRARLPHAFTLVELMIATAVVALIVMVLASIASKTAAMWRYTAGKVEQFREAREGFEAVTQRISQATLNTYWDYDNATAPTRYERRSELRFISGPADRLLGKAATNRVTHATFFHAPLGIAVDDPTAYDPGAKGLESLLNTCGFFVEFGSDEKLRPPFLRSDSAPLRWRFRLMEFTQPTEYLAIYNYTSGAITSVSGLRPKAPNYATQNWFTRAISEPDAPIRVRAENIVAMILTPRLSKQDEAAYKKRTKDSSETSSPLAPEFFYDSGPPSAAVKSRDPRYRDGAINPLNQLPPIMQVTMVAIDETSAQRLNLTADSVDALRISTKFQSTAKLHEDLAATPGGMGGASLEDRLIALGASYRVFSSNVPIRAAKWSREQVDSR